VLAAYNLQRQLMSSVRSRRRFIAGLAVVSIGQFAHGAFAATESSPQAGPDAAGRAPQSDYLLAPGLIHLNTASLGATPRAVLDRTLQAWRELESSPVLMAYGKTENTVLSAAEQVRVRAAAFLGCDADEVLITRCTTDAMNTLAQGMHWAAGDRVLTTDQEHDGGSMCWAYQAQRQGAIVDRVAIAAAEHDSAAIVRRFAAAITPSTRVISVSHVLSSTGLRMPIFEISALARQRGILCVVDGAQAAGAIAVDVKALGCHAYATSGHKWLMGPKGTGLLYVNREASAAIQPIQWQDGHHYGAESAGVGPQPLAIGLGAAIERMQKIGMAEVERHGLSLRNRAYAELKQIARLRVVGPPPGPLATAIVACVLPDDIDSMTFRDTLLNEHGIIVKMIEKRRFNGFRLSPHILNTPADIDAALKAIRSLTLAASAANR
jgi:selenocysteine lyase/cysteine desulfurase